MPGVRTEYIIPLNNEDQKTAEEELGEDPTRTSSQVEALRAAILQTKHITVPHDDTFLLAFLRHAKFSLSSAVDTIEEFAKLRVSESYKHLFTNEAKLSTALDEILKRGIIIFTPGVIILRSEPWDTKIASLDDVYTALALVYELALLDPVTQIVGVDYIHDYKGATLSQLGQFTPSKAAIGVKVLREAIPIRVRGTHFYRGPMLLNGVISILKSLSSKTSDEIQTHSKESSLHSKVDPRLLPKEMGGTAGTCKDLAARCYEHVQKHLDHFQKFSVVRYDGSKKGPSHGTQGASKN